MDAPLSKRGNELLWRNGRLFGRSRGIHVLASGCRKLYFKCKTEGCTATATKTQVEAESAEYITEGDLKYLSISQIEVSNFLDTSNHAEWCFPDDSTLSVHLAKQRYKELASVQDNSVKDAFLSVQEDLQRNNPEIVVDFGSYQSLASMGKRSHSKGLPKIQSSAAVQRFPHEFTLTSDGQQHLMYIGVQGDRPLQGEVDHRLTAVIFSTRTEFLRCIRSNLVSMDGTFQVCPRPYEQFFTIHGFIGDKCIPLIKVGCNLKLIREIIENRSVYYLKSQGVCTSLCFK